MFDKLHYTKDFEIILKQIYLRLYNLKSRTISCFHTRKMKRLYNTYKTPTKNDKKIIFWETGGMPELLSIDVIIAYALRIRGTDVHMVICDGTYRACIGRNAGSEIPISEWSKLCPQCKTEMTRLIKMFDLPFSYMGDYVSKNERKNACNISKCSAYDTIDEVQYESVNLGNPIKDAILRCTRDERLNSQTRIVQEYVYSGLICACSAGNLIKKYQPTHFFMTHGTYVDWGPARLIARSKNIPVVLVEESYLQGHYCFGHNHDKTAMDLLNMPKEYWEYIKNIPMKPTQLKFLENYIMNRYKNNLSLDIRTFFNFSTDVEEFKSKYDLQKDKPTWAIFSHIFWDYSSDMALISYNSYNDWLINTVKIIKEIPEVNWLIKVHPSEITLNYEDSEYSVISLIQKNFAQLPDNIKIIPPDETINPLNFYDIIDGGITCCGTVGLELPILGKPVIIGGLPYYSQKGFTYDGFTPEIYRQYLKSVKEIKILNDEKRSLAQKFGYYYYIQKQIPISMTLNKDPKAWVGTLNFNKRKTLAPKQDPFIEFICEKILDGSDFIMNDQLVELKMQIENN